MYSLSLEANSASIPNCELRPFCSSGCLNSTQRTVDPGSLATGGCSIMNGGSTRDMTWEQVRQMVHGNNNAHDLVSHQENPLCSCTRIIFTRKYQLPHSFRTLCKEPLSDDITVVVALVRCSFKAVMKGGNA